MDNKRKGKSMQIGAQSGANKAAKWHRLQKDSRTGTT